MLKIERRGFISCVPLETAADNHGYICWGKIYEVAEELELLDYARGEGSWEHPAQNGAAGGRFCLTNSGG